MVGAGSRNPSLRNLIKNQPYIASAVIRFNTDLAAHLHPDQQRKFIPELPTLLWIQPRLAARISKIVATRTDLEKKLYLQIPSAWWAMILLPPQRLQRLALHVGALVLGIRVRSSLSREHVMAWKNRLGTEAYRFALNSASLLPVVQIPLAAIASDSALDIGIGIIGAAIAPEPESLKRRVYLKLPGAEAAMALEAEKAIRLITVVIQILEGEWYSSCAKLRV
jgi:hypothetical protein